MKQRLMVSTDLDVVLAIEQAANDYPWTAKNFESSLKSGHHVWLFINDRQQIVAFTVIQQILDEIHLLNICVEPSQQGRGIGRKVLTFVINFAKKISATIVLLEVRRSNKRAQQLYLHTGFNEMAVRKDYYPAKQGREDAILMAMDLSVFTFSSH